MEPAKDDAAMDVDDPIFGPESEMRFVLINETNNNQPIIHNYHVNEIHGALQIPRTNKDSNKDVIMEEELDSYEEFEDGSTDTDSMSGMLGLDMLGLRMLNYAAGKTSAPKATKRFASKRSDGAGT